MLAGKPNLSSECDVSDKSVRILNRTKWGSGLSSDPVSLHPTLYILNLLCIAGVCLIWVTCTHRAALWWGCVTTPGCVANVLACTGLKGRCCRDSRGQAGGPAVALTATVPWKSASIVIKPLSAFQIWKHTTPVQVAVGLSSLLNRVTPDTLQLIRSH